MADKPDPNRYNTPKDDFNKIAALNRRTGNFKGNAGALDDAYNSAKMLQDTAIKGDENNVARVKSDAIIDRASKLLPDRKPTIGSFKKGGSVRKTGKYRLHKGERVLNTKQAKRFGKVK